jgi:hypothetical protein
MKRAVAHRALASGLAVLLSPGGAGAAGFDELGAAFLDPNAAAAESFEAGPGAIVCDTDCSYELLLAAPPELALEGSRYARFSSGQGSFEATLALPGADASYRFRLWLRHGRAWARAVFEYTSQRPSEVAWLFPTGRVTSDGWVELESNPVSVSGSELGRALVRLEGTAIDVDAIEVVREGVYEPGGACLGSFDASCGPEAVCIAERCRQGARYVPPLPAPEHREAMASYLMGRVRWFFGGRLSRIESMPAALAEMELMLTTESAWQFWGAFARGVRRLDDWHTSAGSAIETVGSPRRLGVCFIEGRGDLSQDVWPSQAGRADVLVSHVGPDANLGLKPGDRLVAVDGQHPLDWARTLVSHAWSWHVATDPDVDAELAESLRGRITAHARNFSVVRCDASKLTCSDQIETIDVVDVPAGGFGPSCDNRPSYHLPNPPEQDPGQVTVWHQVPFWPWREVVLDSQPGENIWGMTWDNLYGTDQGLTPFLLESNALFRAQARGVILDHRAGNGGTIDAPQALTQLVREPFDLSVGPGFMTIAGYDGPETAEEGVELFERFRNYAGLVYRVGSDDPDLALPVALIIHRDGSASDWLPHGMKGAPNVRIFGPHETAGAFSSFYQFSYWSRLDFQLASGDTIDYQGNPLIGHGIEPDEIVEHTQTSLLQQRDLPYEAALAWVRSRLK